MRKEVKRILGIILPIAFISVLFASVVVSVANDVYAFVKPDETVVLKLDAGTSVDDLSDILAKNGILKNPFVFSFYVKRKNKIDVIENFSGELTLNSNMSYREILSSFSN